MSLCCRDVAFICADWTHLTWNISKRRRERVEWQPNCKLRSFGWITRAISIFFHYWHKMPFSINLRTFEWNMLFSIILSSILYGIVYFERLIFSFWGMLFVFVQQYCLFRCPPVFPRIFFIRRTWMFHSDVIAQSLALPSHLPTACIFATPSALEARWPVLLPVKYVCVVCFRVSSSPVCWLYDFDVASSIFFSRPIPFSFLSFRIPSFEFSFLLDS